MRPVPQSVYDRARLLAGIHNLKTVAELIGKDLAFVSRMRSRGWRMKPYPKRERPSDFAIQSRHMSLNELCRHYRAGTSTVSRWRREIGQ